MKKAFILLFSILMLTSAESASAQTGSETESGNQVQVLSADITGTPSRRVYCFTRFNSDFGSSGGITVFNTKDPSNMQLLFQHGNSVGIYAGAAANDTYYTYNYFYNLRGPEPVGIIANNLRTGEQKTIVDWIGEVHGRGWPKFQDMTYDYKTNTMYAVAFRDGIEGSYLASIDLTNGELKKVVGIERIIAAMAVNIEGVLYVMDMKGTLCTLNKENGKLTTVMSTEFKANQNQSMEFDHTDEALYWATGQLGVEESYLIKFDLSKKTYENLGVLGGAGTQVLGMYIPFMRAGYDVPAAATEINVIPGEKGEQKAVISWKNPTQTFGNTPLLEITSLTLSRDGEVIKTYDKVEDLVLGKAMSFEDKTVKNGMHVYSISAINSAGAGEEGKVDCFVGFDKPAKVNELKVQSNAFCKSATLTWKAPTEGQYGAYFTGDDLSYTIVRYPDELEIATNIKELTFTDDTSFRLTGFTYHVYANNRIGASKAAVSEKVVIGSDALEIPYSFDFIDEGAYYNNWMVYDNSGDGNTWRTHSPMGKVYFNDPQLLPAAEYMMDDPAEWCDEWLITPPITLPDREKKVLTFGVRNIGEDYLRITMGNNNTYESQMVELRRMIIDNGVQDSNDPVPFEIVTIDLGEIAGTFCFGFHLQTPNNGSSIIFQLSDIYVGAPSAIINELVSDVNVFNINNTLNITGDFTNALVYNVSGVCMGQTDASQSQINTSNWPSGVYYVKVMNGNSSKVHKAVIK